MSPEPLMPDLEQRARDLIAEIGEAFADVPYPGDDRIGLFPDDHDSIMLALDFRGKHWREITVREIVDGRHREDLLFMTAEAFAFYLPAYLLACIVDPREADLALDSVVQFLTKPEGEDPYWTTFFEERVRALNWKQRAGVRHFLEYIADRDAETDFVVEGVQRALIYWRQVTTNGSSGDTMNDSGGSRGEGGKGCGGG